MATGYATLYGDMAGGFAVIKDVPKTLVYALCNDLNERAGREVIPQTVIDKPPSAELAPGQLDSDSLPPYDVLDPIIEGYVEDDLSVGELDRARPRRRAHAARRAHGRSQRVQAAPGRARRARVAEGVRQGSAAPDHQSLARLTRGARRRERVRPAHVGDRAAARARAGADRGDDRVRRDVQARAGRARRRHAGRLHPVALLDGRGRAAAARDPQRLARAVDGARRRCARKDFLLAVLAFGVVGFAGYWFQNAGPANARRRRTPRSSPGLFVVFTPLHRDRGRRAGARRATSSIAVGVRGRRPVPARRRRRSRLHAGDALTLGVRVLLRAVDPASARTSRSTSIRSRSPPANSSCSSLLAIPVVAIGGLGHVTTQVLVAAAITGVLLQRARVHAAAVGPAVRRAVARRGDPRSSNRSSPGSSASGSASGSASSGYIGAVDHPARHRDRRIARRGGPAPAAT